MDAFLPVFGQFEDISRRENVLATLSLLFFVFFLVYGASGLNDVQRGGGLWGWQRWGRSPSKKLVTYARACEQRPRVRRRLVKVMSFSIWGATVNS